MSTKVSFAPNDPRLAKCRSAIHSFIATATAKYGRGSVILLPEFEEQKDGSWLPVQGNGIRPTVNNSAFMRFGKMTINGTTGKPQYLYTNHFGDNEGELLNMLSFVDPTAGVGTIVRGIRLVVHESLTPFSRTNPSRDIKWADQQAGIACTKLVPDTETGELKPQPIYRRTKVFFADDEGNYPPAAINQLIQHDNTDELSAAASAKWAATNKTNSAGIQNAARIQELKAKVAAGTATKKEKAELVELED